MNIQEPTAEQCSNNTKVFESENQVGYAIWYPQMGGYVGKAVAILDKNWQEFDSGARMGGCVNVYVWHDGEFPFGEDEQPRELHHCDPMQFVHFGETLERLNSNLSNKGLHSDTATPSEAGGQS